MTFQQRGINTAVLALAGVCAVTAGTITYARPALETIRPFFVGGFWLFAAVGFGWAGINRVRREVGRRRWFIFLTSGVLFWLSANVVRILLLPDSVQSNPYLIAAPWILGLPLVLIGLTGLAWPPGIHRVEALHIAVDSALSIGALLFIWTLFVLPRWEVPSGSTQAQVGSVGRWAFFFGLAVMVLFIASSRRTGSLPLKQLLLLFGGMEILLVSGTVREIVVAAGEPAPFALVGYWIGVAMLVAMLRRSAAEVETPRQQTARTVIAFLLPASLVLMAGLLVIDLALESQPDSRLLGAAPFLWTLAVLGVAGASAGYMLRLRLDRHGELTNQLSESAERGWISALLRDSSEYVFVVDPTGRIVYSSPRSQSVLKTTARLQDLVFVPSASAVDQLLSGVIAQATPAGPHQMVMHAADGSMRIVLVHLRPVREISFAGFVVSGTDVTAQRHMAAQLESTGQRDELTGLLSPLSLTRSVAEALGDLAGSQDGLGYAVVDLVDFGVWNDSLGRPVGDEILRLVASQTDGLLGGVQAVGRVGGDSFGILLRDPAPLTSMQACLNALSDRLRGLILSDDSEVELSFRAGFTIVESGNADGLTAANLTEQADVALRRARRSRHAMTVRFQKGMNEDLVRMLTAEVLVREAISKSGLVVHYQPIVSLTDGHLMAVEALARIVSGDGDLVHPSVFIEAAERSGLISDLDRAVRSRVVQDWDPLARISDLDRISVNVAEKELVPALADELLASGRVSNLIVEVTESSILSNPQEAGETLRRIRAAGGLVAIDDFGSGYSSMAQIASLPCDILKIDRGFVSSMLDQPKSMSLIRAIIQLGHDLGMQIIAEGVESVEQEASLRALGCDFGQGFYYSRPVALREMLEWIVGQSNSSVPVQRS
jgi:diguanylate cyclase (GGDEF)-like protein